MSATNAPFGFRPAYNPIGLDRAKKYTIASGYGTAINKWAPVILNTNGTITAGTAGADIKGVFIGCEYLDSTGRPAYSTFWPAGTTGTSIVAWVADDLNNVYEVQADGSVPQSAIGDECDVSNVNSAASGLSQATVSATLAGAGAQGQFRIVGFGQQVDNTPGDAFTILQVQVARAQDSANKVAI